MTSAVLLGAALLAAAGGLGGGETLQRALDAGGVVEIPAGVWEVAPRRGTDAPMLSIRGGTTLRCAPGAVIRLRDGAFGHGETLNEARMLANIDVGGRVLDGTDIRIEGCTFDGNDRGNGDPSTGSPELITCVRCERFVVRDSVLQDVTYQGVATYLGAGHVVERNRLHGVAQTHNADAIQLNGGRDVRITGNTCANCSEAFVVQHATGRDGAAAHGAVIADNTAVGLAADAACRGAGAPFACCEGPRRGSGRDLCAAGRAVGSSIIVVAEDVVVRGNTVRNANQISVQAGRGFPVRRVLVEENLVLGGRANGILLYAIAGVPALDDVVVQGNEVRGVAASGVQLRGIARGVVVIDNTLADNCARGACATGVLVGDGVERLVLQANRITVRPGSGPAIVRGEVPRSARARGVPPRS
ncbi:MAG TPA: right-handed parallel beta-helix repeat-containing protein [Candidatus Binatia bacterium]|jgi:hypothetical protein|nr:right-handed parallel beta-helix repeat-containing protein [Candidatus Binatia bacterium]